MEVRQNDTALVVTDPQNDFLSPKGVTWGLVGESVQKNRTVEHISSFSRRRRRTTTTFSFRRTTTIPPTMGGSSAAPSRR